MRSGLIRFTEDPKAVILSYPLAWAGLLDSFLKQVYTDGAMRRLFFIDKHL